MARITAGVGCSHVPAIGIAMDTDKTHEDYWKPVFAGFEKSREWMKEKTPDVIFLVFNDHCTAFDARVIPTFALGCGTEYAPADEGWGPRPVPVVISIAPSTFSGPSGIGSSVSVPPVSSSSV